MTISGQAGRVGGRPGVCRCDPLSLAAAQRATATGQIPRHPDRCCAVVHPARDGAAAGSGL